MPEADEQSPTVYRVLRKLNRTVPWALTFPYRRVLEREVAGLEHLPLDSVELWDGLRRQHPRFHLPRDRSEWIRCCECSFIQDGHEPTLVRRAWETAELVKGMGERGIFSVGVGTAALEYHLKRLFPDLHLVCGEGAPETVERLRSVFHECDSIVHHDVLGASWEPADLPVLINRLDPLFSNHQWRGVFEGLHRSGVRRVIFVPAFLLPTWKSVLAHQTRWLRFALRRRKTIFVGWARTAAVWRQLWGPFYSSREVRLGTLPSYVLENRA